MATLCSTHVNASVARSGVEALRAAGVPGRDIRLLIGRRPRDIRREWVGGFAGPVAPDAPVGTYGNVRRLRRQGNGTFAGDADRQRQGSFADADRELIVTYDHETAHTRVIGACGLRRLVREAGLDDYAIDRVLDDLDTGHVVVLAEMPEITRSDAQERLEHIPTAA
jgi:hypothetical protein